MAWKGPIAPLWYRVSGLKPRLPLHVGITRQFYRDELWYLVEDQAHNRFHRFHAKGYAAIALMDGKRTVEDIWCALESLGDDRPTQDDLIQLLAQLDNVDLLSIEHRPDFAALVQRSRSASRSKWARRLIAPMFIQVPLLNPDRFLTKTAPAFHFFWSFPGFVVWFVVVGWGATQAWTHWDALTNDIADRVLATDNLLILLLVFPVLKVCHELGHGYATKVFGGHVNEAGILTMALLPMPYIDVTTSTRFSGTRRALVGASGMMVETFLASLAMAVWLRLEPGALRAAAFNVMLIAGVSTLIFNGNPLLRFDAYYILADTLGIANFATRSSRYYGYLVNRYLFGIKNATSSIGAAWEKPWFLAYAPASYVYRLIVLFSMSLFLASMWRGLGTVLAVWTLAVTILFPLAKGIAFVAANPALRSKRFRAVAVTASGAMALYALIFLVRLPYGTVVEGVVWAPQQSEIHTGVEGFLSSIITRPDAALASGQEVATLSDDLLEDRARLIATERDEVGLRLQAAEGKDEVQAKMLREQFAYLTATWTEIRERLAQLKILSPLDGSFLAVFPQDRVGRFLKRGDLIGYVVDGKTASVRIVVPQSEIDLVREDTARIDLRFAHDPFTARRVAAISREVPVATRTLPNAALSVPGGGSISIDPADPKKLRSIEVVFELDVPIPDGISVDRLGERVIARFDHGPRTIAWYAWRRARQLFLDRFEL